MGYGLSLALSRGSFSFAAICLRPSLAAKRAAPCLMRCEIQN